MSDTNDVQSLRDLSELLQQISSATGLSQDAVEAEIEGLEYATFKFNDSILVSPSDFESIIDSWAEKLKAELFSGNGSTVVSSPKKTKRTGAKRGPKPKRAKTTVAPKAKSKVTSAPQAKATSSEFAGALSLPDDYKAVVSHLYGPSLKRIMPQDADAQTAFLEAIANETPDGVELLDHLSVIIANKYTGKMAPEAAYNGLKNKAAALLSGEAPKSKGRGRRGVKRGVKKGAAPKGKKTSAKKSEKAGDKTVTRARKAVTRAKTAKATTKTKTKVALAGMELPKGYRKRVSNRHGPTLKSLLPEDQTLRAAYLKEIIAESEIGKAFLERVADSIKIKYRGRISRHTAYSGLLDKAKSM